MRRHEITAAAIALLLAAVPALAAPGPFSYRVRQVDPGRRFSSTPGTLTIDDTGVAFSAPKPQDARRWTFEAIQQLKIAPQQIEIATYEDRGRFSTGGGRVYRYAIEGPPADAGLVDFLIARVHVPIVSAVLPSAGTHPDISILAHHEQRRGGADGELVATPAGLAFVTARAGQARFWRYADLFAVLPIDRYRLQLSAYEGGPGETRLYVFSLKAPLDGRAYDLLWQRINRPTPRAGEATCCTGGGR